MLAQLSGFEVMRLVNELKALEGAFLQKVYEPWDGLFVLRFKAKSGKKALVHKVGDWVYLTDESELGLDLGATSDDGAAEVPALVRVLRDHITNAFVIGARQLAFDRIIELELRKDDPYFLIFEMFGDGNIILRRENVIVGALKTQVWRHRVIMGGKDYRPPPLRKDPRSLELAELTVLLKESSADLVRTLATSVNLGGTYAEEVCTRIGLEKSLKAKDLDIDQMKAIQEAIRSITSEVSNEAGGIVHTKDGKRAVVSAIRLKKFGDEPIENFPDLGAAVKACYPLYEDQVTQAESVGKGVTSKIDAHLEKITAQAKQQEEAQDRFKNEMAVASATSEAIYINYKLVEDTIAKVKASRDLKGWSGAAKEFPELEVDPSQSTISLQLPGTDGKTLKVTVDLRKDVNDNARAHYESIKVVRDKLKGAERALERSRAEIDRLNKERTKALEAGLLDGTDAVGGKKRVRRKRFWFETSRWFISQNGNIIIGGKDASSNHRLVKKHLHDGDRYIHADIHGAPSVIVKAQDASGRPLEIPDGTLDEACHYAICFSKAWSGMLGSGEAYWVNPEQVSTQAQSGEFVPKGGFIIRGKRNYVRNLDLKLAVGLVKVEEVELVMCAPIDSIKARTDRYWVLAPSRSKKTDVSRSIAKDLGVSVEEVESVLPPGGMDIIATPGKPA